MYIFAVGITVVAAGWLFFVQFMLIRRTGEREVAERQLAKLQDDANKVAIGEAQLAAETAKKEAGEAKRETAELTAKNLVLEAAIAPRRLKDNQQKALASLTAFATRLVEIKSYSSDTEGAILATQIMDALTKSNIHIRDNRLTVQPAGSVAFGVSVEGPDKELVKHLTEILSDLAGKSPLALPSRGFSASVSFGVISGGTPPAATILVGVKPIK